MKKCMLYPLLIIMQLMATSVIAQIESQIPENQILIENTTNYMVVVDLFIKNNPTVYLQLGPYQKRYHELYQKGRFPKTWWMRLRTKNQKEHKKLRGKSHYQVYFDWETKRWKVSKKG